MDDTVGRLLRGRYATVTDVSRAPGVDAARVKTAFHCRKRAVGLLIASPSRREYGPAQSLHESSGFSVFPEREKSATLPAPSQRIRPQVATLFVSRTLEMYVAGDCSSAPTSTTRPG